MREILVVTFCILMIISLILLGRKILIWFKNTDNIIEKMAYINFFIYIIIGVGLCIMKIGEVVGLWNL